MKRDMNLARSIVLAVGALEFNRKFTFPWIARVRQAEDASAISAQ